MHTSPSSPPPLHDALSIALRSGPHRRVALVHHRRGALRGPRPRVARIGPARRDRRTRPPTARIEGGSEEHTSELQSLRHLVCRLLLETKKVLILDMVTQMK